MKNIYANTRNSFSIRRVVAISVGSVFLLAVLCFIVFEVSNNDPDEESTSTAAATTTVADAETSTAESTTGSTSATEETTEATDPTTTAKVTASTKKETTNATAATTKKATTTKKKATTTKKQTATTKKTTATTKKGPFIIIDDSSKDNSETSEAKTVVKTEEYTNASGLKVIRTYYSDGSTTAVVECAYCHEFPCPDGGGEKCSEYNVKDDAAKTCTICGRPFGDGYNGTCDQTIDWNTGKVSCNHYD